MKLDSHARIRLAWMFENQPELVRELLKSNKLGELEDMLERKLQQAYYLVDQTKEQRGTNEEQAFPSRRR